MWFYILVLTIIYWNYNEKISMLITFLHYMWNKDLKQEDNLEERIKKFLKNIFDVLYNIIKIKFENKEKQVYRISPNSICVEYEYCGQKYKLNTKFKKGPNKKRIKLIKNENEENVLEKVEPYLGPNEDFHGIPYTCKDFNFEYLKFFRTEDEYQEFRNDEIIVLK